MYYIVSWCFTSWTWDRMSPHEGSWGSCYQSSSIDLISPTPPLPWMNEWHWGWSQSGLTSSSVVLLHPIGDRTTIYGMGGQLSHAQVHPSADVTQRKHLFPQLFKDPECWCSWVLQSGPRISRWQLFPVLCHYLVQKITTENLFLIYIRFSLQNQKIVSQS